MKRPRQTKWRKMTDQQRAKVIAALKRSPDEAREQKQPGNTDGPITVTTEGTHNAN